MISILKTNYETSRSYAILELFPSHSRNMKQKVNNDLEICAWTNNILIYIWKLTGWRSKCRSIEFYFCAYKCQTFILSSSSVSSTLFLPANWLGRFSIMQSGRYLKASLLLHIIHEIGHHTKYLSFNPFSFILWPQRPSVLFRL